MQAQQPVIRTYKGRDRRSAEEAYRNDAQQAVQASWYPVAHRWTSEGDGHELAVVFEYRGEAPPAPPSEPAPSPAIVSGGDAVGTDRYRNPERPDAVPIAGAAAASAAAISEPSNATAPGAAGFGAYAPPAAAGVDSVAAPGAAGFGGEAAPGAAEFATSAAAASAGFGIDAAFPAGLDVDADAAAYPDLAPPAALVEAGTDAGSAWPAVTETVVAGAVATDIGEALAEPEPTFDSGSIEPPPDAYSGSGASEAAASAGPEVVSGGDLAGEGPPPGLATDAAAMAAIATAPAPDVPVVPVPAPAAQAGPAPARATAAAGGQLLTAAQAHARAVIHAIDLHCAGEPLRLIRTGFPPVPFAPILDRRRWVREHADAARQAVVFEPRGHRDMYAAILLPPFREDADVAVLFMHNEGYSTMCGHGTIAIATALVEERLYPATEPETVIRLETPAGIVTAFASVVRGAHGGFEVRSVRFRNVPSYLHAAGLRVRPDGLQLAGGAAAAEALPVDLAFGGAYYGIVSAADLGLRVVPEQTAALTTAGAAITAVLRRDHTPAHPTDADLGFVYGTIIVDDTPVTSPNGRGRHADIRNVTIFADAEVDRSPCGSGTSAILAQRFAQHRISVGQELVNAGITGETFRGRVEGTTTLGNNDAVLTSVEGTAYVTGYQTLLLDDRDPLGGGFLLR